MILFSHLGSSDSSTNTPAGKNLAFWSLNRTPTLILQSPSHLYGCLCLPPFKCSYIGSTVPSHVRFLFSLSLKYFTISTKGRKLYKMPKRKDFAIMQIRACEQTAPSILQFPHLQNKTNWVVTRIMSNYLHKASTIPCTPYTLNKSQLILWHTRICDNAELLSSFFKEHEEGSLPYFLACHSSSNSKLSQIGFRKRPWTRLKRSLQLSEMFSCNLFLIIRETMNRNLSLSCVLSS